jgi:hypothetical protein
MVIAESLFQTSTNNTIYAGHRLLRDGISNVLITNDGVCQINVGTPLAISSRDILRYFGNTNSTASTTFSTQIRRSYSNGSYGETVTVNPSNTQGIITVMEIC